MHRVSLYADACGALAPGRQLLVRNPRLRMRASLRTSLTPPRSRLGLLALLSVYLLGFLELLEGVLDRPLGQRLALAVRRYRVPDLLAVVSPLPSGPSAARTRDRPDQTWPVVSVTFTSVCRGESGSPGSSAHTRRRTRNAVSGISEPMNSHRLRVSVTPSSLVLRSTAADPRKRPHSAAPAPVNRIAPVPWPVWFQCHTAHRVDPNSWHVSWIGASSSPISNRLPPFPPAAAM